MSGTERLLDERADFIRFTVMSRVAAGVLAVVSVVAVFGSVNAVRLGVQLDDWDPVPRLMLFAAVLVALWTSKGARRVTLDRVRRTLAVRPIAFPFPPAAKTLHWDDLAYVRVHAAKAFGMTVGRTVEVRVATQAGDELVLKLLQGDSDAQDFAVRLGRYLGVPIQGVEA